MPKTTKSAQNAPEITHRDPRTQPPSLPREPKREKKVPPSLPREPKRETNVSKIHWSGGLRGAIKSARPPEFTEGWHGACWTQNLIPAGIPGEKAPTAPAHSVGGCMIWSLAVLSKLVSETKNKNIDFPSQTAPPKAPPRLPKCSQIASGAPPGPSLGRSLKKCGNKAESESPATIFWKVGHAIRPRLRSPNTLFAFLCFSPKQSPNDLKMATFFLPFWRPGEPCNRKRH